MIKNIFFKFLFLLQLVFSASISTADNEYLNIKLIDESKYISLHELIKSFNFDSAFDYPSQKGRIYYGNHHISYGIGFSYILIDGKLQKSLYPVIRNRGEILFPIAYLTSIINAFYPSIIIKFENERVYFDKKNIDKDVDKTKDEIKIKVIKDSINYIIIDPGHGGKDPGAIGKGGIKEKNITLKIVKYIEEELNNQLKGIKIKLTRDKDIFIELSQRADIANRLLKEKSNGLFVSIHVNASLSSKTSGFETYFLSQNPTNEDARNTAALENDVVIFEEKKGKKFRDVDYIEAMMLTTQIQKESSMLAESIQNGMAGKISANKSRGVRKADFFVLRGSLMPAALVEVGFITNKKESLNLMNIDYQKKIARGVAEGIIKFIKKYNATINK